MANKPIGTLGMVDYMSVGGVVFTDLTNLISLSSGFSTSSNKNAALRKNSSSGYQVTAGKTYTIRAVQANVYVAEATASVRLLYADNDVGLPGTTAFTNPIYYGTYAGTSTQYVTNCIDATTTGVRERAIIFGVAAQKYACIDFTGSTGVGQFATYGYEA